MKLSANRKKRRISLVVALCVVALGIVIFLGVVLVNAVVTAYKVHAVGVSISLEYHTPGLTDPKSFSKDGNYFFYYQEGDHSVICGYYGQSKRVAVPSMINGKQVTVIGSGAFRKKRTVYTEFIDYVPMGAVWTGSQNIETLVIPDGVAAIEDGAFSDCAKLTNLTLPKTIKSVSKEAFEGESQHAYSFAAYYSCTPWYKHLKEKEGDYTSINGILLEYHGSGTEVLTPKGITAIAPAVFSGNKKITKVTVSDGITSIGEDAFKDCTGLRALVMPDSLVTIDSGAFSGCTNLTFVTLPSDRLKMMCVSALSDTFWHQQQMLNTNGFISYGSVLCDYKGAASNVVIPDRFTVIMDDTFSGDSTLEKVTIPGSVTIIGANAFYNCKHLSQVALSNGLVSIEDSAFSNCYSLEAIVIPDSVTSIGNNTFEMGGLQSVTLSKNLTRIGDAVFYRAHLKNVIIPNGVTSIGKEAFKSCEELETVNVPDSVTSVGSNAFADTPWLKSAAYHELMSRLPLLSVVQGRQ
ncbi:MAG: leucine-rich repeat domain-containing protein [Coriobacteriia bacterium]|nr:leucine-rich repeat domain-containing protein [Coriobacteriia bacterium]